MTRSYEELKAAIPEHLLIESGKFVSKLTFHQRCEILALYRAGVSRANLAEAYGIDRRTITHIRNHNSPHYKSVRAEILRLGPQEFDRTYLTEEALARVSAIKPENRAPISGKLANKYRGIHLVKNEFCQFEHRINIEWKDELEDFEPGWYYQDFDCPWPETWLSNGPESIKTSHACLEHVKENLSD